MAIIETRGDLIYMIGEDIPSLILERLKISRKRLMSERVYAYDQANHTLILCHQSFLERSNARF